VEVIVAAAVVSLSVIIVIAVVRKGQEQMWSDQHRRAARAVVDTTLEGSRFLPRNIATVPTTIADVSCTLDVKTKMPVGVLSVTVTPDSVGGVKYDSICAKVKWTEPGSTTADSVMISRLVPVIIDDQLNIAPDAVVTVSSNCPKTINGIVRPRDGYNATDGIIANYAEWASDAAKPTPVFIKLEWPSAKTINRIILHDRVENLSSVSEATLSFSSGSDISLTSITKDPYEITFQPRTVTWIKLVLTTYVGDAGLAEIEVFEKDPIP
jgi:hypothetical protein